MGFIEQEIKVADFVHSDGSILIERFTKSFEAGAEEWVVKEDIERSLPDDESGTRGLITGLEVLNGAVGRCA